jgi:hypothetical protein
MRSQTTASRATKQRTLKPTRARRGRRKGEKAAALFKISRSCSSVRTSADAVRYKRFVMTN